MRLTTAFAIGLCVAFAAVAQEPTPAPAPAPAPAPEAAKPAVAGAPAAAMGESVKIVCDGKAKDVGEINLVFTPATGGAKTIRVTLTKGMDKKDVCRDIAKELSVALSGSPYQVEHYDDDKVKVEGKDKAKFSLTLGAQTAKGVTLEVK